MLNVPTNSEPQATAQEGEQFPMSMITSNLSHQLDYSDMTFFAIKELVEVIKEEEISGPARERLEGVVKQLFMVGKSLSEGAYQTGTAVQSFIEVGRKTERN